MEVRLVWKAVTGPTPPVAQGVAALHLPALRVPEREAVVVAVRRQHDEVVDGDWRDLGVQTYDDLSLGRVDRCYVCLGWEKGGRLRTDERVRPGLSRGHATCQGGRDRWLQS